MRNTIIKNNNIRVKRALRVRKHLRGTSEKPRLCVVKANNHIQVQLIDDETGNTLGQYSNSFKRIQKPNLLKKIKLLLENWANALQKLQKKKY